MNEFFDKYESTFSVISSILLGLMAIVISCNSNRIAKFQSRVDYFEHTPEFHFRSTLEYVDTLNSYANESIEVYKKGKAKNIEVAIQPVLEIDATRNKISKILTFPVRGYFDMSSSGTIDDRIKKFRGIKNNYNLARIENLIESELKLNGFEFAYTELHFYSKISYMNFINDNVSEFYEIGLGGESTIEESTYDQFVSPYENEDGSKLYLWFENGGDSNYDQIIDIVKKNFESSK